MKTSICYRKLFYLFFHKVENKLDSLRLLGSVHKLSSYTGKYCSRKILFYHLSVPYGRKSGYFVTRKSICNKIFKIVYFYLPVTIDYMLSY